MNRLQEVENIIQRNISVTEKIKILEEMLIDLKGEMEAQDQNMNPEISKKVSEAYKLANQYIINIRS